MTAIAERTRPARPRLLWAGGIVVLAFLAGAILLLAAGGGPQPTYPGLPDPGKVTGYGLPVVKLVADLAAIGVVGSLMVPMLVSTAIGDELPSVAFRAVRSVRRLALVWLAAVVVAIWFTLSDQLAVPAWELGPGTAWEFVTGIEQGRSLGLQAVLIVMVAIGSRWVLTVREAGFLLALALIATLPPTLTGHSASSGSHDTAIVSLLLHVGGVMLWTGGVLALWWFLAATPELRLRAATRFSSLAAWCAVIVLLSGQVNAIVRLGSPGAFVTSGYGLGVLAKTVAILMLGYLGTTIRRTVLARGVERGLAARRLAVLSGVELTVMAVAVGLGVALSRTPPPVGEPYTTAAESLLAGEVPPAPSLTNYLTELTPSGIGLAVCLLGGAGYLVGVVTLRRRGESWPVGRTVCWFLGLLVVAYATIGGLGVYSRVLFSAHMVSHMLLAMVAPLLLVLGAPIVLALRALPGADLPGGTGPRQMLASALRSRPVRLLTNPVVAALLFVGSVYVIYLTDLFDALMLTHLGHAFMELHFLLVGILFYELLIGIAPLPRRIPYLAAIGLMLISMSFHAFFAISVMNTADIIGEPYYSVVSSDLGVDLAADQYLAGSLTWAFSEVPMLLVMLAVLFRWFRADSREASRHDRKAERDGDADLAAYNAWLAQLGEETRRNESR